MPPLRHPVDIEYVTLPARRACVAATPDVLVVGGGPAGLGAAYGAAKAGAGVILVERYGFLGGNATAALVMPLMSFYTQTPQREQPGVTELLPSDHGEGNQVLFGVVQHFIEKLVRSGGAIRPSLKTGYTVPFDPEIFKLTALELLDEAGVQFLFHAFASGVVGAGKVDGVIFETKSGPLLIKPKVVIDCTGDGDIAAAAGAPYEIGRESDGLVQPMTLMFRMVGFDKEQFDRYVHENPTQWRGVHGLWDLIRQASEAGELDMPREDLLLFATPHAEEVSVNSTRITKVLGVDVWDLTYAEWESRRQMRQIARFLNRHVPGFAESYVAQSGVQVGVRETRRIIGGYHLTVEDILSARKFDDVIARSTYPVDIHNPAGKGTILKHLPAGESYDIPLRALLPRGLENVLVAGRCISGTHEAFSSYRVMPVSMATGQAAGVCAALAVRSGGLCRVGVQAVQAELSNQGAHLGSIGAESSNIC